MQLAGWFALTSFTNDYFVLTHGTFRALDLLQADTPDGAVRGAGVVLPVEALRPRSR